MKKFLQSVGAIKTTAAFAFTGLVMFATVASMFLGRDSISIGYIWQMIFLSLIFGCLHLHAFSEHLAKKTNMPGRMAVLGLPMFLALSAFAHFFQWFPTNSPVNWLIFIGLYAGVFIIATFALRTAFRVSGIKYNQMLAVYKASREKG